MRRTQSNTSSHSTRESLQDGRKIPAFVMIETAVFGRLTPNSFMVYAAIIKHANNITRVSWPGHSLLAKECRCSVSTVRRAIALLAAEKLIKVRKEGRVGEQKNVYTVLSPVTPKIKGNREDPGHREQGDCSTRAGTPIPQNDELDLRTRLNELERINSPLSSKKNSRNSAALETTVFPEGFEASEENQSLAKQRQLDISTELKKFAAWHRSKDTRFKDWQAALAKWLHDAREGKEAPTEADRAAKLLKLAERHRTLIRSHINSGIPVYRVRFPCQGITYCPACEELKERQKQLLAEDRKRDSRMSPEVRHEQLGERG